MEDIFYKLLLIRTNGIGAVKYTDLLNKFENPIDAAKSLMCDEKLIDSVRREMDLAATKGIVYITCDDPRFPPELKNNKFCPPIITVRGNLDVLAKKSVSIVGTRHASAGGMRFISDLSQRFAENDYVVVSGMAAGTDTAAHVGALNGAGNAQTIAVLGGGADYIWPMENERLYYQILERGAVISDMPVGFKPVAKNFVLRNRIVAGISPTLILGEADSKSGSMTTAKFAKEYNKDIYAIPSHPADPRAAGPNQLIRENIAKLCVGASDFFEKSDFNHQKIKEDKKTQSVDDLLDKIGFIPVSESVLSELVKKSIMDTKTQLVVLEFQGKIRKVDGGYIRI